MPPSRRARRCRSPARCASCGQGPRRGGQRAAVPAGKGPRLCADSARAQWQSDPGTSRRGRRPLAWRELRGEHFASARRRGRPRSQPAARHRADRRGLCGRPRLRRRGGPLSRRDRALRRGHPRHRPAQDGRHLGDRGLAPRRARHAGADAHRARPLERQGAGLRRRRRRLCGQAVPSGGGAGAHPRAAAPLGRPRQERVHLRPGAARTRAPGASASTAIRSSSPATNTACSPT